MFVYSGHGDLTQNDGLVICPSDVTASGDDLVNAVSLLSLQKALGGLHNLTTVLDCCHSGGGMAVGSRKTTSLRGLPWPSDPAAQPARPVISDRVFFAAQRGQTAYQAEFMAGQTYGAFTWAFMTVKSRRTGITRTEIEFPITVEHARDLLLLCHQPLIDKTRHILLHEGSRWEIDDFHGANAGLIVAEIELSSEETVFARPEWLGDEVSHDFRYSNASLSERPFGNWLP